VGVADVVATGAVLLHAMVSGVVQEHAVLLRSQRQQRF